MYIVSGADLGGTYITDSVSKSIRENYECGQCEIIRLSDGKELKFPDDHDNWEWKLTDEYINDESNWNNLPKWEDD